MNHNREVKAVFFLRLSVYDKMMAYPYDPLSFVSSSSTAPESFSSAILIGALVRASRICNNAADLKAEINNTCLKLLARGHPSRHLHKGFRKWLLDYYPEEKFEPFVKDLQRHFHWVIKHISKACADPLCDFKQFAKKLTSSRTYIRFRDPLTATRDDTEAAALFHIHPHRPHPPPPTLPVLHLTVPLKYNPPLHLVRTKNPPCHKNNTTERNTHLTLKNEGTKTPTRQHVGTKNPLHVQKKPPHQTPPNNHQTSTHLPSHANQKLLQSSAPSPTRAISASSTSFYNSQTADLSMNYGLLITTLVTLITLTHGRFVKAFWL